MQCTSPIRRYYDLLNHYNLKAAMHAATVPRTGTGTAVKSAIEGALPVAVRLQTLSAVKMVRNLTFSSSSSSSSSTSISPLLHPCLDLHPTLYNPKLIADFASAVLHQLIPLPDMHP